MDRYQPIREAIEQVEAGKRALLLSLLDDFIYLDGELTKLRKLPRFKFNPKNPEQQLKLPAHEMIKDFQAQKNDIANKLLKALGVSDDDESPLAKALARFRNNG